MPQTATNEDDGKVQKNEELEIAGAPLHVFKGELHASWSGQFCKTTFMYCMQSCLPIG